MTLEINQQVRVRVAIAWDSSYADQSEGQVHHNGTTWAEQVWVDTTNSYINPQEFGDVEYWCIVTNLAVTRGSITRPLVILCAYITGGLKPDAFETVYWDYGSGNSVIKMVNATTHIATSLQSSTINNYALAISTFIPPFAGWTGKLPSPLPYTADFRIVLSSGMQSFGFDTTFPIISMDEMYFTGDITVLNTWLAAFKPRVQTAIFVACTLIFTRNSGKDTYIYQFYAKIHAQHTTVSGSPITRLACDTYSVRHITQGEVFKLTATVCGSSITGLAKTGASPYSYSDTPDHGSSSAIQDGLRIFSGSTNSVDVTSGAGGTYNLPFHIIATEPYVNVTYTFGADFTITVDSTGHITNIAVAGYSSDGTVIDCYITGGDVRK